MAPRPKLRFLCDNNVPDSVARYLQRRGHSVLKIRTVMAADSPDPVVAQAAIDDERILVSWDKDFQQQRFMAPRYASLSRLAFSCPPSIAVERLKTEMALIEGEWALMSRRKSARMIVAIGRDQVRFRR